MSLHHHTNIAMVLTILIVYTTRAQNLTNCHRNCGGKSLQYPFGFSEGCEVQLNCTNDQVKIGDFLVHNVTTSNIFINLPKKCNRTIQSVKPLFGDNFAPTWNNSFLVQNCTVDQGSCVIPASLFVGRVQGEDKSCDSPSTNISCFEQSQRQQSQGVGFVEYENLTRTGCKFLFSAIAIGQSKELSLQFQVVELGWWLQGPCSECSPDASCTRMSLPGTRFGFRCQCLDGFEGDGFIKGTGCRRDKNNNKGPTEIIAVTVIIGTIIIVACAFILWKRTIRTDKSGLEIWKRRKNDQVSEVKLPELTQFEFKRLALATNNFGLSNRLGQGGFGTVYKGTLKDGKEIAVKRLSRASRQGLEEFMNEVVVISKLQHRNLVKLLGCCIEGDEKILIYEYLPNRSLDAYMFAPINQILNWGKRFNLIEGIARGLLYLHRDSRLRIIHRDLKLSNILLDGELNPKISDFGLAKIFDHIEDEANTRRIVGTYGYMSPEYAMEGLFSEKSDIFSFGVLLLEIVCRRKNTSFYEHDESLSLLGFVWKLWNANNITSIIDPEISNPSNNADIMRCIHIGLLCVQELARDRPTMTTVVSMLNSETINLPHPKQPAFIRRQTMLDIESSLKNEGLCSINYASLTDIRGR